MKKLSHLLMLPLFCLICFACRQDKTALESNSTPSKKNTLSLVQEIKSPAKVNSSAAELTKSSDGKVLMSWLEKTDEKQYTFYFSTLDNNVWSMPKIISKGENWFVNWADLPSIIKLPDGSLAAHWLVKSADSTYSYDVNITRSFDNGQTWTNPIVPHTDGVKTEHGFVSLFPWNEDKLGAIWLDGRKIKVNPKGEYDEEDLSNEMILRFTSIDKTGKLFEEAALDERVCDCCPTSVAITPEGAIAVYRDRSKEEFRDISFVNYKKGKWSEPQTLYPDKWQINGCPVNGPVVVANGKQVAVAWFSAANDQAKVKMIFSSDAGITFNNPITVSETDVIGRVDLAMLNDGSALIIWLSGKNEIGSLNISRVWPDGKRTNPITVAETTIARKSGIPKLVCTDNQVIIAWTDPTNSCVRTAKLDIQNLN